MSFNFRFLLPLGFYLFIFFCYKFHETCIIDHEKENLIDESLRFSGFELFLVPTLTLTGVVSSPHC